MDQASLITILAIIFLIFLSAMFSGSETALTVVSRARLHKLAADGLARAKRVLGLVEDKEKLIGGILLGNNLVNILASALATSVMINFFGDTGVFYATLLMTAIVLIFAEVLPKTYAISNPERMALRVAPLIQAIIWLLSPIVGLVRRIVNMALKVFGVDTSNPDVLSAHEEIRGHIDLHSSEGGLIKEHKDMLGSILDLDHVYVEDVMVHRRNMLMIDANEPMETIIAKVTRAPFTRIPLYDGDNEDIVGILHAKDILRAYLRRGGDVSKMDIKKIMSPPWFVPETTTLREQLNAFQNHRSHFALVIDEYGAIQGLITLEDILEEIVGDITDEHDRTPEGITVNDDGTILVDGTITIRDLNRQFDWSLPDEDAITIAGLIINEAMIIPIVGQRYSFFDFEFEVAGRQRNQITAVKIFPPVIPVDEESEV